MSDDLVEQLRVYASISSMGSVATLFGKAADEIERLRRSPVAEGGGWLPIDSAPKDGTPIIGYQGTTGDYHKRMAIVWCWDDGKRYWSCADYPGLQPTHWHPLPSPPVPSQEGADK